MRQLSARGQQILADIANRHGFGFEAIASMLDALIRGDGSMAQFNHPEFGGSGQWMRGGMTMVSDMFNSTLKGRVDSLCSELSALLAQQPDLVSGGGSFQSQSQDNGFESADQRSDQFFSQPPLASGSSAAEGLFAPLPEGSSGYWWPAGLGSPNSTGSQNNSRYAYFAQSHRLAIEHLGRLTVYDTLDHQIGGVSQQQSFGGSLQFNSQYGLVDVGSLPIVTSPPEIPAEAPLERQPVPQASGSVPPARLNPANPPGDIFAVIEKLAGLRDKGILTEAEFSAKKTELLSRI